VSEIIFSLIIRVDLIPMFAELLLLCRSFGLKTGVNNFHIGLLFCNIKSISYVFGHTTYGNNLICFFSILNYLLMLLRLYRLPVLPPGE